MIFCMIEFFFTWWLISIKFFNIDISLIYLPISDKIRELNWKPKVLFNYEITQELLEFNDNNLDEAIKHRINDWMDDILDIIVHDYSSIQIKKINWALFTNQRKQNQFFH